jgi:hypothetical protein
MPHHWYNIARERQEASERVFYETDSLRAEIDRLRCLLLEKNAEVAALRSELRSQK